MPKYIQEVYSRIYEGKFLRYEVRFQRTGKDQYSRNFSVKRLGTKEKALLAAKNYVRLIRPTLIKDKVVPRHISEHVNKSRRNKSGVIGVHLVERRGKNLTFVARWVDKGVNRSKSFSTDIHGYQGAFQLACAHREARSLIIP